MSTQELLIDPEEVDATFRDCLYTEEEIKKIPYEDRGPIGEPMDVVLVMGVTASYGFQPERLETKREQVKQWLNALPDSFKKSGGGGASFLEACNQANGVHWTGLHERMEQLFCLGEALKLVKPCLPHKEWGTLPGGMPYYTINDV